jgi:hypothetical protein
MGKKTGRQSSPVFLFRAPGKKTGSTGGTFMMRAYKRLFAGAIMMAALLLAGCANLVSDLPQGQWLEEEQVQALVEDGIVFPDHRYYYLGSITAPDSFIAIHKEWRLRTRVWAEVEMTPQRLAGWLQWYRTEQYGICEYRGGRILAPDGRQVGYWYSQNRFNLVYVPEPAVVEVYKPHAGAGMVCGEPGNDGFFPGKE